MHSSMYVVTMKNCKQKQKNFLCEIDKEKNEQPDNNFFLPLVKQTKNKTQNENLSNICFV